MADSDPKWICRYTFAQMLPRGDENYDEYPEVDGEKAQSEYYAFTEQESVGRYPLPSILE